MSTKATQALVLRCPACGGDLADGVDCRACGRRFDTLAGIPDLRLAYVDPYETFEQDVEQARSLAARFDEDDLEGLLRQRWSCGHLRGELVERFVESDLAGRARGEATVAALERELGRTLGPADWILEVGCGAAALSSVLAERGAGVVATDVSLRWCVLARKQLEEAGADVPVVCCSGESLPFAPESFDLVVSADVIEHVPDAAELVCSCARVLKPGGVLFLATPNRFSLGLEPHVRLWGVGYLPRRLAPAYVRVVRRARYDHVRLLSAGRLRTILAAAGLRARIVTPPVAEASEALYRGLERRLIRVYNRLRERKPFDRLLLLVGPFFHVVATKVDS